MNITLPDGSEIFRGNEVFSHRGVVASIMEEKEILDEAKEKSMPDYSEVIVKETPNTLKAEIVYKVSSRYLTLQQKLEDAGPAGSRNRIALAQRVGEEAIELLQNVDAFPYFHPDCIVMSEPIAFLCWRREESSLSTLLTEIVTGSRERHPKFSKTFRSIDKGDYEKALKKLRDLNMSDYD